MTDMESEPPGPLRARLAEVAWVFLRLGLTAFGGPAAHVAMMEREIVRRRRWITHERFLDLFGAANLIPGPSSSELAIYLGYERSGALGLVVGGACFILPAALLTGAIAWAYSRFGALPQVSGVLYGIKPVIIVIVAQAVWSLGPRAAKSRALSAIGVIALVADAFGVDPLAALVGAGLLAVLVHFANRPPSAPTLTGVASLGAFDWTAPTASSHATLLGLFLFFVKVGAVVFGSGYVLLAFLRADLVDRLHWLTESQLLDAVAVGQVTPGPVFSTATFIGYLLGGLPGAVVATVGIFLPGFLLVAVTRPLVVRVRRSAWAGAFLDGVNVASLALMVVVTFQLARAAFVDPVTIALAAASGVLLLRWKVNSGWLIAGGALVGVLSRGLS